MAKPKKTKSQAAKKQTPPPDPEQEAKARQFLAVEESDICMEEDYERQEKKKTPEQAAQDARFRWMGSRTECEYMPTGQLALHIKGSRVRGMRHRWGDGKKQRVENCLNKFVMGLINMAVAERAERLESERRHRQWEEEWRKERERQRRLEEEQRRIKALCSAATAHHEAQKIRAYVDAVREAVIEREGQIDPIGPMVCWLRWATRQADRLDPIAEHSPSALDESGETKFLEWEEKTKTALKPYARMLGLRETDSAIVGNRDVELHPQFSGLHLPHLASTTPLHQTPHFSGKRY